MFELSVLPNTWSIFQIKVYYNKSKRLKSQEIEMENIDIEIDILNKEQVYIDLQCYFLNRL